MEDRLLVLHLDSPAVLVDGAGRPTDRLDTDHLSEILDVGAKCERQWVRRERVGGWHAASNLPKPDEIAVSAGSVYRLELDDAPDPVGVQTLLDRGIGLRRAEGFGWISVPDRPRPAARTEATASVPPAVSSAADGIVDRLRGSGRERWVRDKLREYREHLAHGGQPNAGILMLPQAEELTPLQHRGLELLLKTGDSVRINAVIERLDAIVRRVAQ